MTAMGILRVFSERIKALFAQSRANREFEDELEQHLQLHDAKIMTVGERAEDVFYMTDFEQRPLSPAAAQVLRDKLMQALDRRRAA